MKSLSQKLKHYRLNDSEYQKMKSLLGHEPNNVEWALFSALWSEHCSYKSSRIHLKKFSKTLNSTVVNAAGENAGVIDLGEGERIAFKMESHNHPSFIEPYQGAATGVGGILRDIFTMGARPIALADYLCFGQPKADRMSLLVDGVVRGISGYGNSVGVPTVTGQTNFHFSFDKNILVNAMAVGLFRPGEKIALSKAKGPGNFVVYVGAKTGKDGVHGAAMASESFDEDSESKKPNVQIGDPYFEKLLIESCLEVIQMDLVVAIQDMGAAGLTSSSFEMASKGQIGMKLYLDQVPLRDSTMDPEEILLSESQERMLLVCEPQKFDQLKNVFDKWGLDAVKVGELTSDKNVQLIWKSETLTSLDPDVLVENAPMYEQAYEPWKSKNKLNSFDELKFNPSDLKGLVESVLFSQGASRKPIYRQYDQRVGLLTVRGADHDVAILKLPDSERGLAVNVGCRTSWMNLDAQIGAFDSVYYPCLQMSIKGITAVGLTDCLNFGNPEKTQVMSEFVTSVEAIAEASLILNAPVISGNVSFYNETLGQNITSTPAIGAVGLRKNIQKIPDDYFKKTDSRVFMVGKEWVTSRGIFAEHAGKANQFLGKLPSAEVKKLVDAFIELSLIPGVLSTQMVGEGGMIMSLAKMSITNSIGLKLDESWSVFELVKESLYQAVFEVEESAAPVFEKLAKKLQLDIKFLGETQDQYLEFNPDLKFDLHSMTDRYQKGLEVTFENLA